MKLSFTGPENQIRIYQTRQYETPTVIQILLTHYQVLTTRDEKTKRYLCEKDGFHR